MSSKNRIVVQVLIPRAVPSNERSSFEAAVVEFLFGTDHLRPELLSELPKRGISANALAAASQRSRLAICPEPDAREFVPSSTLAKFASATGMSLTVGGSVDIEFEYDQASKMEYPANALYLNLKLPKEVAQNITDELTGEIVTSLFGNCELAAGVQSFLAAHGVDPAELAHKAGAKFRDGTVPLTTRVSATAASELKRHGLNVDQFGTLHVRNVSALP